MKTIDDYLEEICKMNLEGIDYILLSDAKQALTELVDSVPTEFEATHRVTKELGKGDFEEGVYKITSYVTNEWKAKVKGESND